MRALSVMFLLLCRPFGCDGWGRLHRRRGTQALGRGWPRGALAGVHPVGVLAALVVGWVGQVG